MAAQAYILIKEVKAIHVPQLGEHIVNHTELWLIWHHLKLMWDCNGAAWAIEKLFMGGGFNTYCIVFLFIYLIDFFHIIIVH